MIKPKSSKIILIIVINFLQLFRSEWDENISKITREEYDKLVTDRDANIQNEQIFFDQEDMKLIKQDQNSSWLCNKIEDVEIKYISTLSMTTNSEVYLANVTHEGESHLKVIKLVNFEIDHTDKILNEVNFGFMYEKDKHFSGVINCFYDLREGRGERLNLVMNPFPYNLAELIMSNKMKGITVDFKLSMFMKICVGLKGMHVKKIIHRDLSLDNIIINYEETSQQGKGAKKEYVPLISDLGWASYEDEVQSDDIENYIYRAPSVFSNDTYGQEVDSYALGIILYSLLTNKMPHEFIYSIDNYKTVTNFMNVNDLKSQKDSSNLFNFIKWMMEESLDDEILEKKNAELKSTKGTEEDFLKIEVVFWTIANYKKTGKIEGFSGKKDNKKIVTPNNKQKELMAKAYLIYLRQYIINNEPSAKKENEGKGGEKVNINDKIEKCIQSVKSTTSCKGNDSKNCLNNFEKCYLDSKAKILEPNKMFTGQLTGEMKKFINLRLEIRALIFAKIINLQNNKKALI
jgi:serine/threonine protein kinase